METESENYIYDNQTAKFIGDTTIKQMGGYGKLQAMIGATNFQYSRKGEMSFKFKMFKKAQWCRVTLNGKDLYDMEFIKVSSKREKIGGNDERAYYMTVTQPPKTVETFNDLYADMLKPIFEKYTGLDLSL